jgi:hypothetical protein
MKRINYLNLRNMNFRLLLIASLMLISVVGYSQTNTSVSLKLGYDKNNCIFQDLLGTNYNHIPDFNAGVDVAFNIGKRFRIRGEVSYVNISYTRDFGYPAQDENVHISKLAINNLDINPYCDYRLFTVKNFDFYLTGGMRFEFTLGDYGRSRLYNGDKSDSYYINEDHRNAMWGAGGGFILKYRLTPQWAIIANPEYTSFFNELYDKNNMATQRMSTNFGVEWSF